MTKITHFLGFLVLASLPILIVSSEYTYTLQGQKNKVKIHRGDTLTVIVPITQTDGG